MWSVSVLCLYVGQQQCFVQLSTMPVILCRGVGRTKAEARVSAARDALRCMNHVVSLNV